LNFIKTITLTFGNVLATKNFCDAQTLIACHQDDAITQEAAADLLEGKINARGRIPVTVCQFKFGDGIVKEDKGPLQFSPDKLNVIDSVVNDAIAQKAFPGCVVLAAHVGEIIYHKAFGNFKYEDSPPMTVESIFDLASVTKVSATTVSVMRLYDEGLIDLNKKLGDYLPWVKGTNKANLQVSDILLHQAGLVPFIAFYKETIDPVTGVPNPAIYSATQKPGFSIRVAEHIYMRDDWQDTMFQRILQSKLTQEGKYVYSDNDFIFLGKIVEQLTGMTLDQYAAKTFYQPMGMTTTGFKPRNRFPVERIVPTETENHFRRQTMQGDVHDEGASMFGGVAGHAGLFSDAYDLAMLYQMLLNGGEFNGTRYLQKETIDLFTAYHSKVSRRGYGFDKPEKDNKIRREPYPSSLASPLTYGHTGFTGTCVWVDPQYNLVYIFLSNRVYPTRDNGKLSSLGVRGKIQDAIYRALGVTIP
jgi:CubicO group peptidase (beta-lactamase class C family)